MATKCPRCGQVIKTVMGIGVHKCPVQPRHAK